MLSGSRRVTLSLWGFWEMLLSVGTCPNSSSYLGFSVCAARGTRSGGTKQALLRSHQLNYFSGHTQVFLRAVAVSQQNMNGASHNSVGGVWGHLWSPGNFTGFLIYIFCIFFIQIVLSHCWGGVTATISSDVQCSVCGARWLCLCHVEEPSSQRQQVGCASGHSQTSGPLTLPSKTCLGHGLKKWMFSVLWRKQAVPEATLSGCLEIHNCHLSRNHRHNYGWLKLVVF